MIIIHHLLRMNPFYQVYIVIMFCCIVWLFWVLFKPNNKE